jgi:hypothetical protein
MFLYDFVLDFIHLSATGVAEIAESTNLKGCPHTFVYIVYLTQAQTPVRTHTGSLSLPLPLPTVMQTFTFKQISISIICTGTKKDSF